MYKFYINESWKTLEEASFIDNFCKPGLLSLFMHHDFSISSGLIRRDLLALIKKGINQTQLESFLGYSREELNNYELRIPLKQAMAFWQYAKELTNDPALSLHIAASSKLDNLGIVGLIASNCHTLDEAGQQIVRYEKLLGETLKCKVQMHGYHIGFSYHFIHRDFFNPDRLENALVSHIVNVKNLTGIEVLPVKATFAYAEPSYIEEYKKIFRCPLFFNAEVTELIFEDLPDLKILSPNNYILNLLKKQADRILSDIEDNVSLVRRVQKLLIDRIPSCDINVETTASELGMSRQTLYRKLKEEKITYQEILDDLRKRLAADYLNQKKYSFLEIAYLLGFSESSAFNRAFRRWFGIPPGEYLKKMVPVCLC